MLLQENEGGGGGGQRGEKGERDRGWRVGKVNIKLEVVSVPNVVK